MPIYFSTIVLKTESWPVTLPHQQVDALFERVIENEGCQFEIDLPSQSVTTDSNERFDFDIDPSLKHRLLEGLDDIGLTLQHADKIRAYEAQQKTLTPWIFS